MGTREQLSAPIPQSIWRALCTAQEAWRGAPQTPYRLFFRRRRRTLSRETCVARKSAFSGGASSGGLRSLAAAHQAAAAATNPSRRLAAGRMKPPAVVPHGYPTGTTSTLVRPPRVCDGVTRSWTLCSPLNSCAAYTTSLTGSRAPSDHRTVASHL
nr:hypothetical protein [Kibdelosporangium sp. MJ126-NF4]CTQ93945.1 hypothetical protein [Kibdelosporangium sp. MJ126-NF4]